MLAMYPEPRWLYTFGLWVIILFCSACSIVPKVELNSDNIKQLPRHHEITATPFYPQDKFQCGPAALATVLAYYGHERQPQALTPWVFTPDAKGSFPAEMDAVARKEGFLSYPINDMTQLLQEVAGNHPVLVLQNLGTDWLTRWHFAVVVGFDLDKQEIVLRSGALERRVTPMDVFDHTWQRGERWGRVILPPTQTPATAQAPLFLRAASDLEQTGPIQAAEQAYATALQHWPDQPLAMFGLANVQLKQEQYATASQTFARLLTQKPTLAPAWNNYAYALRGLGCPVAAAQAAQCATQLAPDNRDFAASAHELTKSSDDEKPSCPAIHCPIKNPSR